MRMSRYFQVSDNVYVKGRWYVSSPVDGNGNDLRGAFRNCRQVDVVLPVHLPLSRHAKIGKPLDYSEIDCEIVPVVSARVADLLLRLAPKDIQIVAAIADGFPDQYFIVNVVTERRCIDEAASASIEKYTEDDRDTFPNLVGSYFYVGGLKIDKAKVEDAKVFRTWGWGSIIVAEEIKDAFEAAHVKGAMFKEV